MNPSQSFTSLVVHRTDNSIQVAPATLTLAELPPGDVVIQVAYSSLNYKDALACHGHPGVVRAFPHVPGIDCAGQVAHSDDPRYQVGDPVLVTGYGLGAEVWGGYSQYVRVPGDWVVPMPPGLDPRRAMIIGTAGFTAAQSVASLLHHGLRPESGEVVVTGATGGVGMWNVAILARLGFEVVAISGKPDQYPLLLELGAQRVEPRESVVDASDRPLLTARWAGAIDTVGGVPLATILRSTHHRGCVAACGLVAGDQLSLSVHPFILRGVTLDGIDSAKCPREPRLEMWRKLSGDWQVDLPERCVTEITLSEVPQRVADMLAGKTVGRTLVRPQ